MSLPTHFGALDSGDIKHSSMRGEEHVEFPFEIAFLYLLIQVLDIKRLIGSDSFRLATFCGGERHDC